MFYVLSKILDMFFSPLTWALLFGGAGLSWKRGRRISGRRRLLPFVGLAILFLFSTGPVSNALFGGLERSAKKTMRDDVAYDAAVLLGGIADDRAMISSGQPSYNDNVERLLATYDLLRQGRARYAILSGGPVDASRAAASEAVVLADQLVSWGIEPGRIVIENRAMNTRENAVYSAEIVRERGWSKVVIVTSAFHMSRSIGCFRAVGLDVDTLPVDYRTFDGRFSGDWMPRAHFLDVSTSALREWAGRVIYKARGYSK